MTRGKDERMGAGNATSWLGRDGRALLGHVHLPGGPVAGAVVLCPPLGREQVASYRALRQLGDRLAERGLLAVRFAWTGQGDSAPLPDDAPLLQTWQDDLTAVVEQVRGWGVGRVHLVGLRLGALLASTVATSLQPDSLVLWDEVASGRVFLRGEQMMYRADDLASPDDDQFHAMGYALRASDADQLRAIKAKDQVLPEVPTLRVVRGEATGLDQAGTTLTSDEMPAMLETSSMTAHVPVRTLSAITAWLAGQDTGERSTPEVTLRPTATLTVPTPAGGPGTGAPSTVQVRETVVELPGGLPGVLTEPAAGGPDESVLYIAASSEPFDGPSGLWAISAREVAAEGAVALRVDKQGTGELGGPLPTDPLPYMPGFREDVGTAARWLTERSGHRPIAVGLCSGTYFQMVRPNGKLFRKVVGINLLAFDRNPADIPDEVAMATDPAHLANLSGDEPAVAPSLKQRLRSGLKTTMPQPLWRTLGRLGKAHAPDHFLREAAEDTELALYFSPEDWVAVQQQRGEAAIDWARRHGGPFQVVVDEELDHALFGATGRQRCLEVIRDEVRRTRRLDALARSGR